MAEKHRAALNRTLTLSEEEAAQLRPLLCTLQQLKEEGAYQDAVICADMLKALLLLPDEMADLIILDPPYNLTRKFGNNNFKARTNELYEEYLHSWMHAVCRKLKPTGSLYLCGDWHCTSALQRVLEEDLTILNRITWQRAKGRGATSNWKNDMEDIWFAVRDPKHYYFNVEAVKQRRRVLAPYMQNGQPKDWELMADGKPYRLTAPSNFWDDITVPFWSMPENTDHPTQKPEKLYAKLILASSREGDMVFDPFMGSGTSCVVARKLGRHFCGIDQEEEYCLWALKRLAMAQTDVSIQGYEDGVFWERNTISKKSL